MKKVFVLGGGLILALIAALAFAISRPDLKIKYPISNYILLHDTNEKADLTNEFLVVGADKQNVFDLLENENFVDDTDILRKLNSIKIEDNEYHFRKLSYPASIMAYWNLQIKVNFDENNSLISASGYHSGGFK